MIFWWNRFSRILSIYGYGAWNHYITTSSQAYPFLEPFYWICSDNYFRRSSIASIKMKLGKNCMPSSPFQRFWKSILKFKDSMKAILANRNFFLLLVSYGFINGTFYAFIILAGIWFNCASQGLVEASRSCQWGHDKTFHFSQINAVLMCLKR